MSIFTDILHIFTSIFKKLFNAILTIIKKYWWVILLCVAFYFAAPLIGTWLTSIGAPDWMASAFSGFQGWIGGIASSVGSEIASGAGAAWDAFKAAGIGTEALIVGAAALALDPTDTTAAIGDVASTVGSAIGTGVGAVVGAATGFSFTQWLLIAGGVFIAYKVLTKPKQDEEIPDGGNVASAHA